MTARDVIVVASKHLGKGEMSSSARACYSDAVALYNTGKYEWAKRRALDSLKYSVGISHPDYRRAAKGEKGYE